MPCRRSKVRQQTYTDGLQLAFLAAFCAAASLPATAAPPQSPGLPWRRPRRAPWRRQIGRKRYSLDFHVPTTGYDYVKREVMIPMRDGVKLYTVIVVPKGAKSAPMLLTRTPYDASKRAARNESPHMLAEMPQGDEVFVADGYIRYSRTSRQVQIARRVCDDAARPRPLNPPRPTMRRTPTTRSTGW